MAGPDTSTWPALPLRAVLDKHVLDYLMTDTEALLRLIMARKSGDVILLETHLLKDELDGMLSKPPTPPGRALAHELMNRMRKLLDGEPVATPVFVLDVSRLDHAKLGSDEDGAAYEALTVGNAQHAEDALLTMTAKAEGAVLVTADVGATRRARRYGAKVMSPPEFIESLPYPDELTKWVAWRDAPPKQPAVPQPTIG